MFSGCCGGDAKPSRELGSAGTKKEGGEPSQERTVAFSGAPITFLAGLAAGIVAMFILSIITGEVSSPTLLDTDGDGVPNTHDLEPEGDAGIILRVTALAHTQVEEDTMVNLTLYYDGNGDPLGDKDGQECQLFIHLKANTTTTLPSKECEFDTSDWSMLAVGFGYAMYHDIGEGNATERHSWDLFPEPSADTTGYNGSVNVMTLFGGGTIILDGLSDGDGHPLNGRLTLIASRRIVSS